MLIILNENTKGISEIELFINSPNSLYLPTNTHYLAQTVIKELTTLTLPLLVYRIINRKL